MASVIVRWLGIAALLIAYPLLAHYTNGSGHDPRLGALVAIAPLLLMALVLAWRSPRRALALGMLLIACLALSGAWPLLEKHFGLVYWLQNMGLQLILLLTFGRTLLGGRQALCTRFAEALYGPVTPAHERYTRRVTLAWTLFFAAMALTSTLLFFLAPLALWSVFSNFLTLPLVALMFIAEFAVRRWLLPDMAPAHLFDALRAYLDGSAKPSKSLPSGELPPL